MDNTEENKYSFGGGVSGDSRISADAIRFSGWQETALAAELPIKFYTTLEQMGLSDADMAEDDFVGNLDKINATIGDNACFVLLSDVPQFINSIVKQLKDDGIDYSASGYRNINFKMERAVSMWNPIKIELFMDMNGNSNLHRDETIIGYANADGSGFKWYSFQKVAKVQPIIDIMPLNGWEFRWFKMKKVDDMVTFIFTSKGIGVTKNGTVIGIVPEGYRPIENCSFLLKHNGSDHQGRISIDTAGNIKILEITDASGGDIDASGSLITR